VPTATKARMRTLEEIASRIIENLEAARSELDEARQHAENLVTMLEDDRVDVPRFRFAVETEVRWLADYLGPEHGSSQFDVELALRDACELQALISCAKSSPRACGTLPWWP
jgi:hypothetical protein